MQTGRRTNPLLGFVVLALAALLLAQTLGLIPASIYDLLVRAAPALLVMFGLAALLRRRLPVASLLAILLSAGLVAGIAYYAYSSRTNQQLDANRQSISQPLDSTVSLLRIRVATLATSVELVRTLDDAPTVNGVFTGSTNNRIVSDLALADDNSATLVLREEQIDTVPRLDAVGRGTFRLELPPNIPLDVEFTGVSGTLSANLSGTLLERLNVDLQNGNALITLPEYQAQFSPSTESLGTLEAENGDITVFVPPGVAARMELNRGGSGIEPEYDSNVYNYLREDILEARDIETAAIVQHYTITAPRGRIRLQVPQETAETASG